MKTRRWIQMNRDGFLGQGEMNLPSLNNAFGDVECFKCENVFDAGTGEHPADETFICPECKAEFTVSWLEVKK